MKKIAFVCTTINVPKLFDGYIESMTKHGHKDDVAVEFIVIGDTKTPSECGDYVNNLQGENYKGIYLDVDRQKEFMADYPDLDAIIPYKSIQRRNIGIMLAYLNGNEVIIQIDDDNFATADDWVKYYLKVGETNTQAMVSSSTGWFNVCDLLKFDPQRRIYHRGFPHNKRWLPEEISFSDPKPVRTVISAGLWLESPDVDAITHLDGPTKSLGFKNDDQEQIGLGNGTFCPFNTQNTAFHRDLLGPMFCLIMGKNIEGICVERYDDIWLSYFIKKIADHLGDAVVFGRPFSAHRRNSHNFVHDMRVEADGVVLTTKLIQTIEEVSVAGTNYLECYTDLINKLEKAINADDKLYSKSEKLYFADLFNGARIWIEVCRKLEIKYGVKE